jgi:hypothetical protein
MDKILERIEAEASVAGLAALLAQRLTPTDLQTLLLEVYRLRSKRIQPADLLADFTSNRFVRPSAISSLQILRWEQVAFSRLPEGFQTVVLSPVCPLGTNSAVAAVDQNWAVSTSRNTEVVSDSTNVLALECAVRRRKHLRRDPKSAEPVHLATSHRLLRAQHYQGAGLLTHFSTFALCSAGRDAGAWQFELSALGTHIRFYLAALRDFLGPDIPLHVSVSDLSSQIPADWIDTRLLSPIQSAFKRVECIHDPHRTRGRGYYRDCCFLLHASTPSGERLELVDGGTVDWTQKLLSNAKERLIISGIGSERLCAEYDTLVTGK